MRTRSSVLAALCALPLVACAGAPPVLPPVAAGAHVPPCPESPNCVSTAAAPDDAEHHVAPLAYTGPTAAAVARMKALVLALPRTALVEETATSLQFTFTSKLMGFVDDVHIVFVEAKVAEMVEGGAPEQGGRIEYRSASRVGHGDMGVNRARMAEIAAAWTPGT